MKLFRGIRDPRNNASRSVGRLIHQGDNANASRDWAQAESFYRLALEIDDSLANIWVQYGHSVKEQGRVLEAETAYKRALHLAPNDADAALQLGHCLKIQGRTSEAIDAYSRSYQLDPTCVDAGRELFSLDSKLISNPPTRDKADQAGVDFTLYRQKSSERLIQLPINLASYADDLSISHYDALLTYILNGGKVPEAVASGVAFVFPEAVNSIVEQHLHEAVSEHFDLRYYLNSYADIRSSDINHLEHFYYFGVHENRDPSPNFSVAHYLAANPAVRQSKLNPLVHYILIGQYSGAATAKSIKSVPATINFNHNVMQADEHAELVTASDIRRFAFGRRSSLRPHGESFCPTALDLHWVVPDFAAGGGGHMTIFRVCNWLESKGHKVTVWIRDPSLHNSELSARMTLFQSFFPINGQIKLLQNVDEIEEASGDAIIATDAFTVPIALAAKKFKRRFYFVQDFEASFNPPGTRHLLALSTYFEDFDCICASPWLQEKMTRTFGRWAISFYLAADGSIYRPHPNGKPVRKIPVIAFYCRMFTDRRAVELGLLALELLAKRGVRFQVEFFGQAELPFAATPFPARNNGVCDESELARIYQTADIGIVFSATNYSLVPKEMMSAGLPVIELDVESTRAIYKPGTVTMARPDPVSIADVISNLLENPEIRREQASAALEWVRQFTWDKTAETVCQGISSRLAECGYRAESPAIIDRVSVSASVVIPTYNGGALLYKVLDAVERQRYSERYEIICIDSSSSDGTQDMLQARKNIRYEVIPKQSFQHGRTRNLGVELARGEFVAFLTQDALPVDEVWLHNLVSVFNSFDNVGAVFGRHRAYDSASAFIKRDMEKHFTNLRSLPVVLSLREQEVRNRLGDCSWRQTLHFYSDNNSCLRRSIWEQIRIPEVDWGEDQAFAWQLILNGYGKGYANASVVYHSHDDEPSVVFERAKEEAKFFYSHFGYRPFDSMVQAEIDLISLNEADETFAISHEIDTSELKRRLLQNEASIAGKAQALLDAGVIIPLESSRLLRK